MKNYLKCCNCDDNHQFLNENDAEIQGWRKIDHKWICPDCCRNTDNQKISYEEIPDGVVECSVCRYGLENVLERQEESIKRYGWYTVP